jgi:hypothetical protein
MGDVKAITKDAQLSTPSHDEIMLAIIAQRFGFAANPKDLLRKWVKYLEDKKYAKASVTNVES